MSVLHTAAPLTAEGKVRVIPALNKTIRSCYDDVKYLRRFLSSDYLLPSVIQGCFIILCTGEVPRFISVSYFVHLFVSVEANAVSTLHEKYRN